MNDSDKLKNLIKKYRDISVKDKSRYQRIKRLERVHSLYNKAFNRLIKLINKFKKSVNKEFVKKKPDEIFISKVKWEELHDRFIEYFFFHLSCIYMLEENLKDFLREFPNNEHQKKLDSYLRQNNPRLFLFGLRNYITHYDLFPINISVSYRKIYKGEKFSGNFIREGLINVKKRLYKKALKDYDINTGEPIKSKLIKERNKVMFNNLDKFIKTIKDSHIEVSSLLKDHNEEFTKLYKNFINYCYKRYPEINDVESIVKHVTELQFKIQKKLSKEEFLK